MMSGSGRDRCCIFQIVLILLEIKCYRLCVSIKRICTKLWLTLILDINLEYSAMMPMSIMRLARDLAIALTGHLLWAI